MKVTHGDTPVRKPAARPEPAQPARPEAGHDRRRDDALPAADRIEISGAARALQQASAGPATAAAESAGTPDLDVVRIDAVRERIASGEYDSNAIRQDVAVRLLEVLGVRHGR